MITGRQIRAARGLLDWTAADLAQKSGLTRETVSRIEMDTVQAREESLDRILNVFVESGVEFIGVSGVLLKDDELVRISGENTFFQLLDDVIKTCRGTKKPEALFACVIDRLSPPIVVENYRRLRKENIAMRSLVKEGDTYLMGKLEEYRVLPADFFHNNPIIIYGNKVAFMILDVDTNADKMAIIVSNPNTAAAMRNLFEFIWKNSALPQTSTAGEFYDT